ncbi:hypothetical protein F4780DRAFT_735723 [Xylariomycetidae sp. FL0641]|nr:hypothetical protein F4780DRAFT_735723 [Xylariomycetidae sp. FL0641]
MEAGTQYHLPAAIALSPSPPRPGSKEGDTSMLNNDLTGLVLSTAKRVTGCTSVPVIAEHHSCKVPAGVAVRSSPAHKQPKQAPGWLGVVTEHKLTRVWPDVFCCCEAARGSSPPFPPAPRSNRYRRRVWEAQGLTNEETLRHGPASWVRRVGIREGMAAPSREVRLATVCQPRHVTSRHVTSFHIPFRSAPAARFRCWRPSGSQVGCGLRSAEDAGAGLGQDGKEAKVVVFRRRGWAVVALAWLVHACETAAVRLDLSTSVRPVQGPESRPDLVG